MEAIMQLIITQGAGVVALTIVFYQYYAMPKKFEMNKKIDLYGNVTFCIWAFGFMSNALFNTKFELSSCWAGVAAISTAGVVSLGEYWTVSNNDSV